MHGPGLENLTREELIAEIKALREAIREHRDASLHDLCWYQPKLWGLLPEKSVVQIEVPTHDQFMKGCKFSGTRWMFNYQMLRG
jgi:hypothetical protein